MPKASTKSTSDSPQPASEDGKKTRKPQRVRKNAFNKFRKRRTAELAAEGVDSKERQGILREEWKTSELNPKNWSDAEE